MNEEIDDSEFYTQDFTTASDWEIFIARIEEIINQWKTDEVKQDEPDDSSIWSVKSEKITFVDFDFNFYLYRKKEIDDCSEGSDEKQVKNPIDTKFDFELYNKNNETNESCIGTWYGLDEFMVLSPAKNVGINSESRIKILLSSINVVISNLNSEVPIFVQIRDKWQKCFLGVYEGEGIRTNFEMIHLRRGPPHCQYLSDLLDLFKSKIMSPCTMDSVTVSAQFSYLLTDFGNFIWKQDPHQIEVMEMESLSTLPFGVTLEPIKSVMLKATWQDVPDHLIVDTVNHTDFKPNTAHSWSCVIETTEEPLCLLGDCLTEFYQSLSSNLNIYDLLGDYANAPTNDANNPLDLLTEPTVPTISTLLNRATRSKNRKGIPPIPENSLVPLLYFLFPDAEEDPAYPYGQENEHNPDKSEQQSPTKPPSINLEQECRGFKTCGPDSLVWRLAIVLSHALQSLGGNRAFAHLWYEFVQEMRYRWEKSLPIPGLAPGFPDLRTCLLNQKLQMLNCCIERKMARENHRQSMQFEDAQDSSDEEFYECSDNSEDVPNKKYSLWNQPVGRLSKFGDLKLLKTGDPLYIPITQEPILKTEDQLEEDTEVLLKLGDDVESSELRARIMSASLLSDMESFKAANPGSVVEDFIRWYSPRDWIEDDEELDEWGQKKGELSPRMLIKENNIWVQTWESARPVPANRQKRLFDDTREAEKVLQFLDFRTLNQICELIIPVLGNCAIYKLAEELDSLPISLPQATSWLNSILKQGERISRDNKFQPHRYDKFCSDVSSLELLLSQINSLEYKFNPSGSEDSTTNAAICDLVLGKEVPIQDKSQSNLGSRLVSMFAEAQNHANSITNDHGGSRLEFNNTDPFPSSSHQREFVLRVNAVRPAVYSARCPQFMRAILNKSEFRVAGAFSEDIVFF